MSIKQFKRLLKKIKKQDQKNANNFKKMLKSI